MNCSEADSYFQTLKAYKARLEKINKIDVTLESKLRDLLQVDRFYDANNCFSEEGDYFKVAELYQIASDLCDVAASKSQDKEFTKWAEKLALLFKDKIPIEEAAMSLRSASFPPARPERLFEERLTVPPRKLDEYTMETSVDMLIQDHPLELPKMIKHELEEIVGPSKGRALSMLLFDISRQQNLPAKRDYALKMRIGPNIVTFKPDIAIFDSSNNLKAIVETVSNLGQRKAEELSLRLLAIREGYPKVNLFVIFVEATSKVVEFMKPIVDGIYSVEDIKVFLEKIRT